MDSNVYPVVTLGSGRTWTILGAEDEDVVLGSPEETIGRVSHLIGNGTRFFATMSSRGRKPYDPSGDRWISFNPQHVESIECRPFD